MIKQVKQLRVQIDGLAQLTKGLEPNVSMSIDLAGVPDGWNLEKVLHGARQGVYIEGCSKPVEYKSTELTKSIDSLYLAKAWLGKVLQELGDPTPYKNDGKRKSVEDIEETDAKAEAGLTGNYHLGALASFKSKSHIEKVDWLREEIKILSNTIMDLKSNTHTISYIASIATTSCFNHLIEARFWLGFELQRIKENETTTL